MASISRKGKGTWRVVVQAGRDPVTRKWRQRQVTVHGTKAQAEQEASRLTAEVGGRPAGSWSGTVGEAFDRWFAFAERDFTPNTRDTTRRAIDNHLVPAVGALRLERLTGGDLDDLYTRLRSTLKPATIQRIHGVAHRMLAEAVRWGWIAANPADRARPPKQRKRTRTSPDVDVALQILAAAESWDEDFGCYCLLAAATGCRRAELCALRWTDIDLDAGEIIVERAISGGEEGDRKEENVTRLAIGPHLAAKLRALKARAGQRALACGSGLPADGFVFSLEPDGSRPWAPTLASHRFVRIRNSVPGAAKVRLHDLRHFSASTLLDRGVPATAVAHRHGHASTKTTLDRYAHAVPASDRAAADLLDQLLGPPAADRDDESKAG